MSNATIGALRVILGLDTAQFRDGLSAAQKELKAAGAKLQSIGASMAGVGATISAAVTAPLVGLGALAVSEAGEMRSALGQVNAALTSMGDVAGRSLEQLTEQADRLAASSLFEDDQILQSVTANMLTFGNVTGDAFDRAQQAAVNLSARLGQDLQSSAIQVGKALNDPIKGITALSRVGVSFTEEQKAQIKAMVAVGDVAGAQAVILGELERQYGGSAQAARDNAPPMERMRLALAGMAGDIGAILLPVVDKLAGWVEKLAAGFGTLSPQMQQIIVVGGALAAALGPLIVAAGAVVTGVGVLLPVFAAIPAVVFPVVAVIGAAVGAFMLFRDDVEPVIKRLWAVLQKTLGPALAGLFETVAGLVQGMAGAWSKFFDGEAGQALAKFGAILVEVMGNVLIRTLGAAVRVLEGALKAMGIAFSILGDLLTGDFSGAWRGMKALVVNAVQTVGNVIEAVFPGALGWVRKLYEGVKTWLMDKLGAAMDWVAEKARQVGDAFFKLYDRVVGHSYIPDMVEGVAAWMAKLDEGMVKPARRSTEATAEAFRDLRDEVGRVMEGLMTDLERSERAFAVDSGALARGLSKGILTQAEYDQAMGRLSARRVADQRRAASAVWAPLADPVSGARDRFTSGFAEMSERLATVSDTVAEKFGVVADSITTAFDGAQQAADDFAYRFADAMEGVLRGDIKGVLNDILTSVLRSALLDVGRMIHGWGSGQGGLIGSFFKMLPGFATGGSFKVGGSGGIDSQVMAFRATPGEMVDIRRPGQNWKSGGNTYVIEGNLLTPEFWAQIKGEVAAGEARAVRKSADIGRRAVPSLQQRQNLLGAT